MNLQFFCILCCILTSIRAADVKTVYEEVDDNEWSMLSLGIEFSDMICTGISNKNETFDTENYPKNTEYYTDDFNGCTLEVQRVESNKGVWLIQGTIQNSDGKVVNESAVIRWIFKKSIKEVAIGPAKYLTAIKGESVTVGLMNIEGNPISCELFDTDSNSRSFLPSQSGESTSKKNCEVKMIMNQTNENWENWKIYGHFENNESILGKFSTRVLDQSQRKVIRNTQYATVGESKRLDFVKTNLNCSISDPYHKVVTQLQGPCSYDIPKVDRYQHSGDWAATFLLPGEENEFKSTIELITHENIEVNKTVEYMSDKSIRLLFPFGKPLHNCVFERPDNHIFRIQAGIGNDEYEYYGQGYDTYHPYGECGITIKEPKDVDFGTWKCIAFFISNDYTAGSRIDVAGNVEGSSSTTETSSATETTTTEKHSTSPFSTTTESSTTQDYSEIQSIRTTVSYSESTESDSKLHYILGISVIIIILLLAIATYFIVKKVNAGKYTFWQNEVPNLYSMNKTPQVYLVSE